MYSVSLPLKGAPQGHRHTRKLQGATLEGHFFYTRFIGYWGLTQVLAGIKALHLSTVTLETFGPARGQF